MGLLRKNSASKLARKVEKADARVAALQQESTQLQLQRSRAEKDMAQFESQRLRADLDALHARYVELEREVSVSGTTRT